MYGSARRGRMVDVTYQSPLKHNNHCITVIIALKQKGDGTLTLFQSPNMSVHGNTWLEELTHQQRYIPSAASAVLGRCTIAFLNM